MNVLEFIAIAAELVGLAVAVIALIKPIIELNKTIAILSENVKGVTQTHQHDMEQNHEEHLDFKTELEKHDDELKSHEMRIVILEKK